MEGNQCKVACCVNFTLMAISETPAKKIFNISLLRRVFNFAAPYKNKFYLSLSLAVLLAVMAPLRPFLIQLTINDGIKE